MILPPRSLLLTGLFLAAPASPQGSAGTPAPGDLPALLSRVDADWRVRDEPGRLDDERALLEKAEAIAPNDYGVLWRIARHDFWISDDNALPDDEKSKLGKKAWEYGDRATAVNPAGVEGWYFAAVGMGNYSLGIGILKALGEGIEGKFRERLSKAEKIDPRFFDGGIYTAWGRFYYKLPWPKYDARKSEQALQKSLQINPEQVRARVYLAELYMKEKHPKEARALLEEAAAHQPGSYDAPEERRSGARAKELLAEMKR